MKPVYIEAIDLNDFWFQCVYNILDKNLSRVYQIEQGSFVGENRIEFDFITGLIKNPYNVDWNQMLPQIPSHLNIPAPVTYDYLCQYVPYVMTSHKQEHEFYTYGSRIEPQLPFIIGLLQKTPRTNQAVIQVASPQDHLLDDPPCLRTIGFKVIDTTLHMHVDFRSNDLWSGTPANLAALAIFQNYVADEIGIEVGEMIYTSKGMHLYSFVEELAKLRTGKEF